MWLSESCQWTPFTSPFFFFTLFRPFEFRTKISPTKMSPVPLKRVPSGTWSRLEFQTKKARATNSIECKWWTRQSKVLAWTQRPRRKSQLQLPTCFMRSSSSSHTRILGHCRPRRGCHLDASPDGQLLQLVVDVAAFLDGVVEPPEELLWDVTRSFLLE